MSKKITQKALTLIGLFTVAVANAFGDISKAIAGITWKKNVALQTHEGGMGQDGLAGISQSSNGATVTITVTKDNAAVKVLKAFLQGVLPSAFVAWNTSAQKDVYIWGNLKDPVSKKIYKSFFIWGAKFDGDGEQIDSGNGARQLTGQALDAQEFEAAIQVDRIAGNATPVTTLTPSETTMIAWPSSTGDRYALAVLRQKADGSVILLDKDLGDYTETSTGITLTEGLAADEAALIAYLYNDV